MCSLFGWLFLLFLFDVVSLWLVVSIRPFAVVLFPVYVPLLLIFAFATMAVDKNKICLEIPIEKKMSK